MFMLLLEGLHSWTACRVQEAEKLQLNPSENKRTAYLLRERQLGIPLPSAARVMRAQGSCKRTKLLLYAGTMRFPFMGGTHSVRPPLYFNDALFLQVTVPGTCNFVCTRLLFQGNGRSQNTGVGQGARIVHQNPFPAFNTGSCVPLYMSEPLPLHFPSAEHLLLVFFLSHVLLLSKLEPSRGCQKANLRNEAFPQNRLAVHQQNVAIRKVLLPQK